jgi:hypothetical protein
VADAVLVEGDRGCCQGLGLRQGAAQDYQAQRTHGQDDALVVVLIDLDVIFV